MNTSKPISHQQASQMIQAAVDDCLDPGEAQALQAHLQQCSACRQEAERLAALEQRLKRSLRPQPGSTSQPRPVAVAALQTKRRSYQMARMGRNAASQFVFAVAILALLAGGLSLLRPRLTPGGAPTGAPGAVPASVMPPAMDPAAAPTALSTKALIPTFVMRQTAAPAARVPALAPAPDDRLVFEVLVNGSLDIAVIGADGKGLHNLTDHPAKDWGPVLSPDRQRVAFLSLRTGKVGEVFVMNLDGSGLVQLTHNTFPIYEESLETHPTPDKRIYPLWGELTWSPDGTQLVAPIWVTSGDERLAWFRVDQQKGAGVSYLPASGIHMSAPVWTPDGRQVIFASGGDSGSDLFASDGMQVVNLTNTRDWDESHLITISPDGKQVAYAAYQYEAREKLSKLVLRSMKVDGSQQTRLLELLRILDDDRQQPGYLAWSPDGQWIAYYFPSPREEDEPATIKLIRPDGSQRHEIAAVRGPMSSLVWSPDGQWLGFDMNGIYRLNVAAALAGEQTPVMLTPSGQNPDW